MSDYYSKLRPQLFSDSNRLTVADQYELAKKLASNCGYKLIPEDADMPDYFKNFIDGLKRELKIND